MSFSLFDKEASQGSDQMPKDVQRWEEVRKKGKLNYLLVHGVLSWGVPMFFIMTFVVNKPPKTAGLLAIAIALWTAGGLGFGLAMWSMFEGKYQKYLKSRDKK